MAKHLLVIGNDKIGRRFLECVPASWPGHVLIDASSNLLRVVKLLWNGVLPVATLLRMAWADFWRPSHPAPTLPAITTNRALRDWIDREAVDRVYLFRAGLIINRIVLDSGAEILNTHCARVPEYGGLGAIARALRDNAFDQVATLHRVTQRIDEGEVIDTEPYQLLPTWTYGRNEDTAYEAGMRLLSRHLGLTKMSSAA